MGYNKQALPMTAAEAAMLKAQQRKRYSNTVVPISNTNAEVYVKGDGTVVIRKRGRAGPKITNARAYALHQAKGLRGPKFLTALRNALGKAPATMERTGGQGRTTVPFTAAPAPAFGTQPAPQEVLSPVERAFLQGQGRR